MTKTSMEFTIEVTCPADITITLPPDFDPQQTYDASKIYDQRSAFQFNSFKTTTSACQVETY